MTMNFIKGKSLKEQRQEKAEIKRIQKLKPKKESGESIKFDPKPKMFSLYCVKDEDSGNAKVFVENIETGREVYAIVTSIEKCEVRITEALKIYGKKDTSNCIYLKGNVAPLITETEVKEVFVPVEDEEEVFIPNTVSWEEDRRNSVINDFHILAKQHLDTPKVITSIKQQYIVTIIFSSPTIAEGEHKIECDCIENVYCYYYNGVLKKTKNSIHKFF